MVIRADASTKSGTGHVMRCLALAQAWQDAKGHAIFVTAAEPSAIESRLKLEGMEVAQLSTQPGTIHDATQTAALAREREAAWVVADGYHFGAAYQTRIKDAGLKLLFIDDHGHSEHYFADIVLNQNLHAHEALYVNKEPYTNLLLGPRYILLRKEFLKWRQWHQQIPAVAQKVLVTLGGGDADNVSLAVIQALNDIHIHDLEAKIIVGASNPHFKSLQHAVACIPCSIQVLENVDNMADLMAWADAAISAGGTTCWELAFMGLPNLVIITADNQYPVAKELHRLGAALSLGWHQSISMNDIRQELVRLLTAPELRMKMGQTGQKIIDGQGVHRTLAQMNSGNILLRPVRKEDCILLWEWANDPDVRAVSFSSQPIPWKEHVKWFNSRLSDPGCIFYISTDGKGRPVGQIRFDSKLDEAVVSVSVDSEFRGKGYGNLMISLASEKVFDVSNITKIHAYVKNENHSSTRVFIKAGFRIAGTKEVGGYQSTHLVQEK